MTQLPVTKEKVSAEQYLAVIDIMSQYNHRVDDRDFERCAELFHPDAVVIFDGTPYEGIDAIRAWQQAALAPAAPGCHLLANPEVWRADGRLKALSDFVLVKNPTGAWTVIARGRWNDEFHEDDNGTVTFIRRDISFTLSAG